jgi:hypothetical protein
MDPYSIYLRAFAIVKSGGQVSGSDFKYSQGVALSVEGHAATVLGVADAKTGVSARAQATILGEVKRLVGDAAA